MPYEAGDITVRITAELSDLKKKLTEAESLTKKFDSSVGGISLKKMSGDADLLAKAYDKLGKEFYSVAGQADKYSDKIENLTSKISRQQEKVLEMESSLNAMRQQYIEMSKAMGNMASDSEIEAFLGKQLDAYNDEITKLDELERKLQSVTDAQEVYTQKQMASEASGYIKQKTADAKLGLSTVTAAVRTLDTATGGAFDTVSQLASQIELIKQALNAKEFSGVALGAAITGGIGIAVSAVSGIVSSIQKANEEEKELINTALESAQTLNDELSEYQRSMSVISNTKSSVEQLGSARDYIISQFPELVLGYNDENEALIANNENLKSRLELLEKEANLEDRIAAQYINDKNIKSFSELSGVIEFLNSHKRLVELFNEHGITNDAYEQWKAEGNIVSADGIFDNAYFNKFNAGWQAAMRKGATAKDLSDLVEEYLIDVEKEYYPALEKMTEAINSDLNSHIDNYQKLSDMQKTVANNMKNEATERLLAAKDEGAYYSILLDEAGRINNVLSDKNRLQEEYNNIVSNSASIGYDTLSYNVSSYIDDYVSKYKENQQELYDAEIESLNKREEAHKAALKERYDAESESLNAQLSAAQGLSFDISSLDEEQLNKKRRNAEREIALEKDKNAKIILQNQLRYYEEAQQIMQVNNLRISEYQAAIDALDAIDKAADEAKRQRENDERIKEIEENYSKTQAEQERELLAFDEEFAQKREELLKTIEKPPSNTAKILAQEELAALEKQYYDERAAMLLEHEEALSEIQEQLDEEKLSQKEETEQLERDARKEALQEQINDVQNAAAAELEALSYKYETENLYLQESLNQKSESLKAAYDRDLAAAEEHYDALEANAKSKYETMISDEQVYANLREEILKGNFKEIEQLAAEHAANMKDAGAKVAEEFISGYREWLEAENSEEAKDNSTTVKYDNTTQSDYMTYGQAMLGMGMMDQMWDYETWLEMTKQGVPWYGDGGYVTRPHLAVVGDEPEWIVPTRKLPEFMAEMLQVAPYSDKIVSALSSNIQLPGGNTLSYTTDNSSTERTTNINIEKIELSSDLDAGLFIQQLAGTIGAVSNT